MKLYLLGLIGAIMLLSSCGKDDDSTDDQVGNANPYNTAFNVSLSNPIDETNVDQISWSTTSADLDFNGSNYFINADDGLQSSFYSGAFNLGTGTQTVLAPMFTYMGQLQDVNTQMSSIIDITAHDEVNQLISGTYRYQFIRYFQSSTVTYTISRTGELIVTFNNVHYD